MKNKYEENGRQEHKSEQQKVEKCLADKQLAEMDPLDFFNHSGAEMANLNLKKVNIAGEVTRNNSTREKKEKDQNRGIRKYFQYFQILIPIPTCKCTCIIEHATHNQYKGK